MYWISALAPGSRRKPRRPLAWTQRSTSEPATSFFTLPQAATAGEEPSNASVAGRGRSGPLVPQCELRCSSVQSRADVLPRPGRGSPSFLVACSARLGRAATRLTRRRAAPIRLDQRRPRVYVPSLAEATARTFALGDAAKSQSLFGEAGFVDFATRTEQHTFMLPSFDAYYGPVPARLIHRTGTGCTARGTDAAPVREECGETLPRARTNRDQDGRYGSPARGAEL